MSNATTTKPPRERTPLGANFWKLLTSSGLSNLADGVFKLALPLVAIRYTQEPVLIAGLSLVASLPWLLFALQAGALADRHDRRRIMLLANIARAVLLAAVAASIALGVESIWVLYAVALCVGTAETLYDTSAQSILPQIVGRTQLSRANGRLYAVEMTANQFVGPPLGGFLVATGALIAFSVPAGLWLVAVGMLFLVRGNFQVARENPARMRSEIMEGLRFLWRTRVLRTLAFMTGLFNLTSSAAFAIFVLYAAGPKSAMGLTDAQVGILFTTTAIGSLLGSFAAEHIERAIGRALSLSLSIVGGAVLLITPAFTTNPFIIGGAFFIGGFTVVLWNVVAVSLRQRITPDRLLGRVNSGYRLLAWGTMPLGAAIGGVLGQFLGLPPVFIITGIGTLSLLLFMFRLTNASMDAAEAEAARTASSDSTATDSTASDSRASGTAEQA
ncbi:MFS family permease [Cryobacterium mesophilum]|uniref:MFS transporter n=1 Tax=Terrimesophilobacter mesophilus TaxID=433647 RepID=UPI001829F2C7|nr:MFS transporter [Terrimesophilobacter mesophilus]MBB5632176.1 MFS family permease [Terrimesophilobacter mesophilus]